MSWAFSPDGRAPREVDRVMNANGSTITVPSPALFHHVSDEYAHVRKVMRPAAPIAVPGVYQKWYLVHPAARPFSDAEISDAQAFLLGEVADGRLELTDEAGFTVQHRCGSVDIFYVCSWRNDNELWETIYTLPHGGSFQVAPRETKTGTYCVWVIPAIAHEQQAWVTYLESARDDASRAAWARDQIDGEVG